MQMADVPPRHLWSDNYVSEKIRWQEDRWTGNGGRNWYFPFGDRIFSGELRLNENSYAR